MRIKTQAQADKILDAAARLFGTHRFHEVRMEDIAAEATVGKGTLYRYFQDKQELYLALLERASRQFTACLREVAAQTGCPLAQLEAIVSTILHYFDEHPHLLDLILRAELLQAAGSEDPWHQARQESIHLVRDVFAEGQRRGEFVGGDSELLALMLLGGLRAVLRFGPQPRPADLSRQIVTGFLCREVSPQEPQEPEA